jgi:uncharacterized protein (DUF362 family)
MSKVAIVELNNDTHTAFNHAIELIGNIDDLNTPKRPVTIKVGVFNHKIQHYATVDVVDAIINGFNRAPQIFVTESDNYKGTGTERLQIWKSLFTKRVAPFNLSEDTDTRDVNIADEKIPFSHILFKPNVFVSVHTLRKFDKGSVLKNLLGLIPDRKKVRFHKKLEATLLDAYEAVGGIDIAVIDGTYAYQGSALGDKPTRADVLLVGRDAVAVETVGATLVGLEPEKMPIIREAVKRGLGEGNIENIEILGNSLESIQERFTKKIPKKK